VGEVCSDFHDAKSALEKLNQVRFKGEVKKLLTTTPRRLQGHSGKIRFRKRDQSKARSPRKLISERRNCNGRGIRPICLDRAQITNAIATWVWSSGQKRNYRCSEETKENCSQESQNFERYTRRRHSNQRDLDCELPTKKNPAGSKWETCLPQRVRLKIPIK